MAYDIVQEEGIKNMDKELFFDVMNCLDGIDSVHLAGVRESFSHPDIFELLDYASKKVKKEVRVNTNGQVIPNAYGRCENWKEVESFFEKLPKNVHIYLSFDKYHEDGMGEDDLFGRVCTLLKYSNLHGFNVTFNRRVIDKNSEELHQFKVKYANMISNKITPWWRERELYDKYIDTVNKGIVNRILKMGKSKNIEGTRYIDLSKLANDHAFKPMIGIRYDGSVVSNFIAAYLPKSNRLSVCELGNLNEESLYTILKNYDNSRDAYNLHMDSIFGSMISDIKSYPFVIEYPYRSYWKNTILGERREEIMENTANEIVKGLNNFHRPFLDRDRLISIDGNLRYDVTFKPTSEKEIKEVKSFYHDMFNPNPKIGRNVIPQKEVAEDKIIKLCIFFNNMISEMSAMNDSSELWPRLLQKIGLPEDEWKIYITRLILGDPLTLLLYEDYLRNLGINKSNYDKIQ
jgi:hypothetical protein